LHEAEIWKLQLNVGNTQVDSGDLDPGVLKCKIRFVVPPAASHGDDALDSLCSGYRIQKVDEAKQTKAAVESEKLLAEGLLDGITMMFWVDQVQESTLGRSGRPAKPRGE